MNANEINTTKAKIKYASEPKGTFPKVKLDGFYQAVQNTDMLEAVEKIKKEKIKKPEHRL